MAAATPWASCRPHPAPAAFECAKSRPEGGWEAGSLHRRFDAAPAFGGGEAQAASGAERLRASWLLRLVDSCAGTWLCSAAPVAHRLAHAFAAVDPALASVTTTAPVGLPKAVLPCGMPARCRSSCAARDLYGQRPHCARRVAHADPSTTRERRHRCS